MPYDDLLRIALAAAERGLDVIESSGSLSADQIEAKSTSTDLVTVVDKATEEAVVGYIRSIRPDDGFIGEESGESGKGALKWVIDPIDGTTNFVYGFPAYAISIAAEDEGGYLCGVVLDVARHDVYTATRSGGAFCNGRSIHAGSPPSLAEALIATGFSYDPARRIHQAHALSSIIGNVRDIRRAGAASLDLVSVASGRVDGYYEIGLWPWDYAAGTLIAREAGALVGSLNGDAPSNAMTLAAPSTIFHPLRDLVRTAFEEAGVYSA
ncbi:MAG: inositol monophosphatase family protein [Acidimicrobiales bacterium]